MCGVYASQYYVVPVLADTLSIYGLNQVIEKIKIKSREIKRVDKDYNIKPLGVFINRYRNANPYDIYYKIGKEKLIDELESKNIEYLIKVTKKYFSDSTSKIYKEKDKYKIIEYMIISLERLLNIGQSFR